MIPRPIVSVIALVVTLVWTGNFIADVLVPGYEGSLAIHAAFMVIVGASFTFGRKAEDSSSTGAHAKQDDESQPPPK